MKPLHFLKSNTSRIAKKVFDTLKNYNALNQNDKKLKRIEKGRTMTEMLGVLAVVGVLSVGGILGYKYGITKWKANETVNELNLRAHDIAFRMEKLIELNHEGEIEMEMGNVTRLGYPIMARMSPQYVDYFEMFLSDVPSNVCKELLKSQWQAPYSIFVGVTEYEASAAICDQAEEVELAYEFYKDLSRKEDVPEDTRHKIQRCNHDNNCQCGTCNSAIGLCESFCGAETVCKRDYNQPQYYKCCNPENVNGNLCCDNETNEDMCCDSTGSCCPTDKPLHDDNGNCYSCDEPRIITVKKNPNNCYACPNRKLVSVGANNRYCAMPCGVKGTDTENKPVMDTEGKCHSCDEDNNFSIANRKDCDVCSNRYDAKGVWSESPYYCSNCGVEGTANEKKPLMDTLRGGCYSCDDPNNIYQQSIESEYFCRNVCPNRLVKGSNCQPGCPAETPLKGEDGKCHDCYYAGKVVLSGVAGGECEDVCPNRIVVSVGANNRYCALPCGVKGTANENKPVMDTEGKCHSCDEDNNFSIANRKDCDVCSNRYDVKGYWSESPYYCSNCGVEGTANEKKPLMDTLRGGCHSCDDPNTFFQASIESKYFCKNVCPNRLVKGSDCQPGCPAETPLMGEDGKCHDCNYTGRVYASGVAGGECEDVCPNRHIVTTQYNDVWCQIKACPADKPLLDYFGACHSCDEDINFVVQNKDDCNICPERFTSKRFDGGYHCSNCGVAGTVNADKPLLMYHDVCYSCDTPNNVPQYSIETPYFCKNVCENREATGADCKRISCSGENRLLGADNQCYPCNLGAPVNVNGDKRKCDVCIERYMDGLYCMPVPD